MTSRSATTCWLMAVLVHASLGCSEASPTRPVYGSLPPPPAPPPFPAVPNASAIYVGPKNLYDAFLFEVGSSMHSRYVLFSDSTFQFQMSSWRFGVVTSGGRYSRTDTTISFSWVLDARDPDWNAGGHLRGDTLHVRYSPAMRAVDFIDGAYVLTR